MYIDSHCHLNFPALRAQLPQILQDMRAAAVSHALVVSVNLRDWPDLIRLVEPHDFLHASAGVHPDNDAEVDDGTEPGVDDLLAMAAHPKVVAIGETGLDYYRLAEPLEWQRERFRTHIRAARAADLPLIIHTRAAAADTLSILRAEGARCGVMHCFTESLEFAQASLELGFYISFSGIVTFKNARDLQEVARQVPLERMLIETDSPYLAPVPFRGKINDPSKVIHVAQMIAQLRGITVEEVAAATSRNYFQLFSKAAS